MNQKIIIDVDTGIDDAQAIMLALSRPDVDVLAITCVQGNTDLEHAIKNTLRILKLCGRLDISDIFTFPLDYLQVPVYRGASESLLDLPGDRPERVHGGDGLGDCPDVEPTADELVPSSGTAAIEILRLINAFPGQITFVSTGPLTNLALVQKLDSNVGSKLRDVVIMGGTLHGVGNMTVSGEFNFLCDPEAAYIVLKQVTCPVYIVPWEVCMDTPISWEWFDSIHEMDTKKSKFHLQMNKNFSTYKRQVEKSDHYFTCDPLAMAFAIDRSVALEIENRHCTVELQGKETRGQMLVDWRNWIPHGPSTCHLISKVDVEKLKAAIQGMLE